MLAARIAERLAREPGVAILNDVVLNQVLVRFGDDDAATDAVVARVQDEGTCWLGGTRWQGRAAMRISVSGWRTTADDADRSAAAIAGAWRASSRLGSGAMRIEGAKALVCGGASGLGAATARRLRADGAQVTIADIDAERGAALAAELDGGFAACDVTDPAQVEAAVAAAGPGPADRGDVRGDRLGGEDRRPARRARRRAVPQGDRGQPPRLLPPAARRRRGDGRRGAARATRPA